jgi:hypothetical protein
LPIPDSGWFVQVFGQAPLYERAGFRPGYQVQIDLGYIYHPVDALALTLQLNTTRKGRDTGAEAEFEDSGSWTVSLSRAPAMPSTPAPTSMAYPGADLPSRQRCPADRQLGRPRRHQHRF